MDRIKYLNIAVINGISADIFKKIFLVKTFVLFLRIYQKDMHRKVSCRFVFNNEKS